ncbi:hypothetical protein LZ480_13550 [Solibacillus sp. MA9]|uniref:Uncharacterized protein n=1 Tax=Solibacillus palustris TaxID=2908203 RepID=A0ABS9UEX0_9BACL|nr:hypothetical protein [Solibacillus sp. MA9]MCH7322901.1 hypothetical protein [Solibacillus sp. MA9]
MNQKIEHVVLDEGTYSVTMVTTDVMEGVQLIVCEEERDATLIINDNDINVNYTQELADILANLLEYTAEELLIALAQQGERRVS